MSYFEQKLQALRRKLSRIYINEVVQRCYNNFPQKVNSESVPLLTMQLFDIVVSMIDEVNDLRETVKKVRNTDDESVISNDIQKSVPYDEIDYQENKMSVHQERLK